LKNNLFFGISTNADIRKGLIKNLSHLDHFQPEDYINQSPFTGYEKETTKEILEKIHQVDFPVLILPIIDINKTFKGALMFNRLIQSE
jgi:hypothetical protein